MNKREVERFYDNYLENVFHAILFWVFIAASLLDWVGVLLVGADDGNKTHAAPVGIGWEIEKFLFILPAIMLINVAIVYARENKLLKSRKKDPLGRKERKTLKTAERKTELAKRLAALEESTGIGQ